MSYSRSKVLENERESGTEKFSLENNPLRRVHIWSLNELRFKGFVIDEGFELTTYFIIDNQNVLPLYMHQPCSLGLKNGFIILWVKNNP